MSDAPHTEELTYGAAMAELEAILRALEGEAVDVDRLTDQVRRAAELIRFCRARIGQTRMQIDQVVIELDES